MEEVAKETYEMNEEANWNDRSQKDCTYSK